ncbi:unnamed protein product, partial [Phaeothamnion confervicola]
GGSGARGWRADGRPTQGAVPGRGAARVPAGGAGARVRAGAVWAAVWERAGGDDGATQGHGGGRHGRRHPRASSRPCRARRLPLRRDGAGEAQGAGGGDGERLDGGRPEPHAGRHGCQVARRTHCAPQRRPARRPMRPALWRSGGAGAASVANMAAAVTVATAVAWPASVPVVTVAAAAVAAVTAVADAVFGP